MHMTARPAIASRTTNFSAAPAFSMPTHDGRLCQADVILVDACSSVSRSIVRWHIGPMEDGGDCVVLTAADARWIIQRDAGRVVVRCAGAAESPTTHDSMVSALQSVAALSDDELRSMLLIADAMLLAVDDDGAVPQRPTAARH